MMALALASSSENYIIQVIVAGTHPIVVIIHKYSWQYYGR